MSETKTFVFGDQGNSSLNALLPFLQQRGIDPAILYNMGGNNGGFFGNNGFESIIALIIVAALFGNNNGNGIFGGGGNNNSAEREMLMSAIQRNGTDLSQLAQTIGCSTSRVHDAVTQVSTQICNLAGQNAMSFQQVINALQAGNATLANQLATCCCDMRAAIAQTNTGLERGFSSVAYETQRQTCDITNAIKDSTAQILAGQAAIEKRELQREIATLQEEKQTCKLGSMIAAATNPIVADLEAIKCRLPKTEVIPATPEYVAINRSINLPYCGYGFGGFSPFGAGWNNGCGSGSLWG